MAGVLGGLFDPGIVLAVIGSLLVIFCIGQLFNPVLLKVEDKAHLEGLAAEAQARAETRRNGKGPLPAAPSGDRTPSGTRTPAGASVDEQPVDQPA